MSHACRCPSCCPDNPGQTYTPAFRAKCEARAVCRMPAIEARRQYLSLVEKYRGKASADTLRRAVASEWESLND